MKIVLREDVPSLGEKWSVVTVKDGYARNYLIPKGLAAPATPGELKQVEEIKKVQARKIAKQEAQLQELANKIDGQTLTFTVRASAETGRLFGSVTTADIAEKLQAQIGEEIDRRKIILDEPIRTLGEHNVTVHLVGRLRPTIRVIVSPSEDSEATTEAAPATETVPAEA